MTPRHYAKAFKKNKNKNNDFISEQKIFVNKAVPSRVHALYLWLEDLEDVMHLYNPFKVHSP